jgi:hypothetical protein
MQFLKTNQHRFRFGDMVSNRYPLSRVMDALEGMAELREIKPAVIPASG